MSKVYLVGAGPGDPDLITWKGRKVLALADCVLYDHLANEALLGLAPSAAERIYVGKKKGEHCARQEDICHLLLERARRGLTVVRLKGGDPFIFGRGGEEAEYLAQHGVEFEIVPGVTTPLGLAAYSGVPLTHRDLTSSVTFITGHDVDRLDWARVCRSGTLVIFMGLTNFDRIAAELLNHGHRPETPALAVRWATRPDQQTIEATLGTLPALIHERGMKPPATIIIGEVVRLRETLNWFERLPLFGRKVVITRAREQASTLSEKLRALGAKVVELPTIEIQPAADYGPLDAAIGRLETYDWLIFTSANGVRFFLERLDACGRDLRALRARLCTIGPATRAAVEALHLKVDLMGKEYVAEGLVEAFRDEDLAGKRVLLPRAAVARDTVPVELARRGAQVDVVEAYRTVVPEASRELAAKLFHSGSKPHWLTFSSSSTVRNFAALAGADALQGVKVASIGPVTSATARELGIAVVAEAGVFTIDGLIDSILNNL